MEPGQGFEDFIKEVTKDYDALMSKMKAVEATYEKALEESNDSVIRLRMQLLNATTPEDIAKKSALLHSVDLQRTTASISAAIRLSAFDAIMARLNER